jgi:hypothetical protein
MSLQVGRLIALYADSGVGKTTQIGEYAKWKRRNEGKNTLLHTADRGGYDSIGPLVRLGVVRVNELSQEDNPWTWSDSVAQGEGITDDIGVVAFDSGTSISEQLLSAAAKQAADGDNLGGRPAPKFKVRGQNNKSLTVGSNVDTHFFIVQQYMLDVIWKSSWLINKGLDVIWTFSTHRGEGADSEPIIGPKLAGKALTSAIPKWFRYTFRMVALPDSGGGAPRHVMYLQHTPGTGVAVSLSNARYPLDAEDPLPVSIEPASLPNAIELIERGQEQAERKLKEELGM